MDAYEEGNQNNIDITSKELEKFIRKSAKDIRDKYIDPPNTTEFGILFLPTEGLYAEVIKRQQLVEDFNRLKMTVAVETNFGDKVDIQINGGDQT